MVNQISCPAKLWGRFIRSYLVVSPTYHRDIGRFCQIIVPSNASAGLLVSDRYYLDNTCVDAFLSLQRWIGFHLQGVLGNNQVTFRLVE